MSQLVMGQVETPQTGQEAKSVRLEEADLVVTQVQRLEGSAPIESLFLHSCYFIAPQVKLFDVPGRAHLLELFVNEAQSVEGQVHSLS